jgi:hypothetical protein
VVAMFGAMLRNYIYLHYVEVFKKRVWLKKHWMNQTRETMCTRKKPVWWGYGDRIHRYVRPQTR